MENIVTSEDLTSNIQIMFLGIHHHEKSVLLRRAPTLTSIVIANPKFLSAVLNVTKHFILLFLLLQYTKNFI